MEEAFPVIFGLLVVVMVVIIGTLIFSLVSAGSRAMRNVTSQELTVGARVLGRRTEQRGGGETPISTEHLVTFELVSGERVELKVPSREFGLLAEGDEGQLTHQGTWYRGFERRRVIPTDPSWEAPGGPSLPPPSD